jgi:predicted DNA-binding transcriptional regulator AlpA
MLLVDIEVPDIADVIKVSRRHIYRMIKGAEAP